jgi:hypothetical protein
MHLTDTFVLGGATYGDLIDQIRYSYTLMLRVKMELSRRHSLWTLRTLCGLGTAVAQWLRYCATNRKVAGSIADGVIGIFH